ncbi:MAG: hypothetical protein R3E32_05600 [Chitinophagales bacterium]
MKTQAKSPAAAQAAYQRQTVCNNFKHKRFTHLRQRRKDDNGATATDEITLTEPSDIVLTTSNSPVSIN